MKKFININISMVLFATMLITSNIDTNAFYRANADKENVNITIDKDNNGNVTYTNKANGKTYTKYSDGSKAGDEDFEIINQYIQKNVTVEEGRYKEIQISLPYGQTSISKLKVKKGKGVISTKISGKKIVRGVPPKTYTEAGGKKYYRDRITGERIYITGEAPLLDYADYTIRIYGKKKGNAKLQFNINDINGNVVAKKNIKIRVSDNGNAVVSATFAGKSLIYDYSKNADNKKYIYYNGTTDGAMCTTKAKGKLKIKLNKNYRLKGIYLKKSNEFEDVSYSNTSQYAGTYAKRKKTSLDLNGDGDCNDVIDGIKESLESSYHYEKVNNGKQITLNKVPTNYENENSVNKTNGETTELYYAPRTSKTEIIVIYQEKETGIYYTWSKSILKKIK